MAADRERISKESISACVKMKQNKINRTSLKTSWIISERANCNNTHFKCLNPYPQKSLPANFSYCKISTAQLSQRILPCSELLASNCFADHSSPCPYGRIQNQTRLSLPVGSKETILEQSLLRSSKYNDRDIKHLRGMHISSSEN